MEEPGIFQYIIQSEWDKFEQEGHFEMWNYFDVSKHFSFYKMQGIAWN